MGAQHKRHRGLLWLPALRQLEIKGSALLGKILGPPRVSVGHLLGARAGIQGLGWCWGWDQTPSTPLEFLTVP